MKIWILIWLLYFSISKQNHCTIAKKNLVPYISDANSLVVLINRTNNYMGRINLENLPKCKRRSDEDSKLLYTTDIDNLITIHGTLGLGVHKRMYEMLKNNESICNPPATKSLEIACSWYSVLPSASNILSNMMYSDESSFVDLKGSLFSIHTAHVPVPTYNINTTGVFLFNATLAQINVIKNKAMKKPILNYFISTMPRQIYENAHVPFTMWKHIDYDRLPLERFTVLVNDLTTIGGNLVKYFPKIVSEFIEKSKAEIPKIKNHVNSIVIHYKKLGKKLYGKHKHLSYIEQLHTIVHIVSNNDYKQSPTYHRHIGGVDNNTLSFWTGFGDKTRKLYMGDIRDMATAGAFFFCWTFRLNCMNETGCNLGIPFLTVPDPIRCFYPQFVPPNATSTIWVFLKPKLANWI